MEIRKLSPTSADRTPPFKILIVVSEFNTVITKRLLSGCIDALKAGDSSVERTDVVHVPGALEIPETLALLLPNSAYDAAIALGCVIRGETGHYDVVVQGATDGILRQSQRHGIPVVFGILTVDNVKQALDRIGGQSGHKGREAGETALRMAALFRAFKKENPK